MSVLVNSLVTTARSIINDSYGDHLQRDDLSQQADGVNYRIVLKNRNIVQIADGAPADVQIFVDNANVTINSVDATAGAVILDAPPNPGQQVMAEYYFLLMTDTTYIDFVSKALVFVGTTTTITSLTDDTLLDVRLQDAVARYTASLAADKMSNLTSWYYTANAGNKGFDKNSISKKFQEMADLQRKKAMEARDDVYKRVGKREAPAQTTFQQNGVRSYTPRR